MDRDKNGRFLPGHKLGGAPIQHGGRAGARGNTPAIPITVEISAATTNKVIADHLNASAVYSMMVAREIVESNKPAHGRSVAEYCACGARLAVLAGTALGGDAVPLRWGDLSEEDYDKQMSVLCAAVSETLAVVQKNKEWFEEHGAFEPGGRKLYSPVGRDFGSVLRKLADVTARLISARAWYEQTRKPKLVGDIIAETVEREAGHS